MTEQERETLNYLRDKEQVCGLDKEERWEIQKLIEINNNYKGDKLWER